MRPNRRSGVIVSALLAVLGMLTALAAPASATVVAFRVPTVGHLVCTPSSQVSPGNGTDCTMYEGPVAGYSGTATGTVSFLDSFASALTGQSGRFVPSTCTLAPVAFLGAGCATHFYPVNHLQTYRADTITASYSGDSHFLPSSASQAFTVTLEAPSYTHIVCEPDPLPITETAQCLIGVTGDNSRPTASGRVTLRSLSGTFSPSATCTLKPDDIFGAICSFTYVPSGSYVAGRHDTITASYSGDSYYRESNASTTISIAAPVT